MLDCLDDRKAIHSKRIVGETLDRFTRDFVPFNILASQIGSGDVLAPEPYPADLLSGSGIE